MSIPMRRPELPAGGWQNAGLLFDKGFSEWPVDTRARGEAIGKHLDSVANVGVPGIYEAAHRRWLAMTHADPNVENWFGGIDGRLFIGLGDAHVLETQVMRQGIHGMPMIPGSALKGLARAYAEQYGVTREEADILFGSQATSEDAMEAGYLIFHDAWWIPWKDRKRPYVRDIVTVHAVEYYRRAGDSDIPIDMESPNPNHQLAVQGGFHFAIEGAPAWAGFGMTILRQALCDIGIGAKVAAGYGYFIDDEHESHQWQRKAAQAAEALALRSRQARERAIEADIEALSNSEDPLVRLRGLLTRHKGVARLSQAEKDTLNAAVNAAASALTEGEGEPERTAEFLLQAEEAYKLSLNSAKRRKKLAALRKRLRGAT